MRFALLCDDPRIEPLIESIATGVDGHSLTCAVRLNPQAEKLLFGRAGIRHLEHWEDLLTARDVDVALVGGNDPVILEGAKQLAAANVPILFAPDAAHGSTFVYELSLIRDDNHVALCPLFWNRYDSAALALRSTISAGKLGRIQLLQLTRSVASPSSSMPLSQARIDAELLDDASLLRWLIGDYNQVTALQTGATDEGALMQNVLLAGRSLPEANWTIQSAAGPDEWRLIVRGERGEAVLSRQAVSQTFVFQWDGQRVEGDRASTARALTASAAKMIGQRTIEDTNSLQPADAEWGELIKCFETVDAAHRSVRRKRTIELHFEPMSERAIFKTQMTAIGCGLLIGTFLLTLCYLGLASVVPLPPSVLILLRTLVFAPLGIFLLAQILLPLTRPSSNENS